MEQTNEIKTNLIGLKLVYLADNFQEICSQADQANTGHLDFVERFSRLEIVEKIRRSTERRLQEARIGKFKPMDQFDWRWPEQIDKARIEQLLQLAFVKERANVIIAGPQGVGKSMLARNIAWKAIMTGCKVRFTSASRLVGDLGSVKANHLFESRISKYLKPDLLIIDEIGYLSFDCQAADLLFEVISRRYETGSIVMTTNIAFKDWGQIFPGAACLTAMIDRLTHHCHIITIGGNSYRHKESMERNKGLQASAKKV